MNKLKFVKPLKSDQRHYVHGERIERWGWYRDSEYRQVFAYVITESCKAYRWPGGKLVAEHREKPMAVDHYAYSRQARWPTAPWLQRSYTKLASLCRKDFETRSKTQETVQ